MGREQVPTFWKKQKTLQIKEKRREKREQYIYFIGDTEKDVRATIKELKNLRK